MRVKFLFPATALAVLTACGGGSDPVSTTAVDMKSARNFELGVQAMIDKAGTTDVYVSAKPLDSFGAPTSLKQVQLKSFDSAGTLRWTKNHSDVPASGNPAVAQFTYTDMVRNQPVQAQVLIQTSETIKTEVYKDKIPVLLRPDLVVKELSAPATVQVGQPVAVNAVISETNGDLGAKNVKMSLKDGSTVVDSIEGVQVDKNGQTAVVFKHKFLQAGTYTLVAQIDGASPSEYDTTNNTKSVTIVVEDPQNYQSWVYLYHWGGKGTYHYKYEYTYDGGNYGWGADDSGTYHHHYTNIYARPSPSTSLSFPLKFDFDLKWNNTTTFLSGTGVDLTSGNSYSYVDACGTTGTETWGWKNHSPGVYLSAYTYTWCGSTYSAAEVQHYAVDHVYFTKAWDPASGMVHHDFSGHYQEGTPTVLDPTNIQGILVVTDADGKRIGGEISANITTYPIDYDTGYTVYDFGWVKGWYHNKGTGSWWYGSNSAYTSPAVVSD